MLKNVFRLISPGGTRARLNVLIFHRVLREPDPLFPDEVDAERFGRILRWVGDWFNVLPLDEAITRLRDGSLPARAAALSFDDGYADNHDVALPLLEQHRLPCSFFVATGFLDGGRMWNDTLIEAVRRSALPALDLRGLTDAQGSDLGIVPLGDVAQRRSRLGALIQQVKYLAPEPRLACVDAIAARAGVEPPDDLMMSSAQVRALRAAGMQVGAHTVSHPILATLTPQAAGDEIVRSRDALQTILGERVSLFAYPNGKPGVDYTPAVHPQMVREIGFDAAVSTRWGAAHVGEDPYQIPRFTPWDRSHMRFGLRLARNLLSS
jgi:peptidoglycan/xylan/chitin deacetylase (PgdA/CDA1 family)